MAESLDELDRQLSEARARQAQASAKYQKLTSAAPPPKDLEAQLRPLLEEIETCAVLIADLEAARPAAVAAEAAMKSGVESATRSVQARRGGRIVRGLEGCGVVTALALLVAAIAVFFGMDFLGDDEPKGKCVRPTQTLGGVTVQLVADDCETETPSPSATQPDTTAPATGMPDPADLPAEQVLYQGTSGRQIGCIACDGQSRFISIDKSTMALGDANRARQEVVWPENGTVVDFGIQIAQPNEGRYGINLFVNGGYSVGCPIETGSNSCRAVAAMVPSPLAAGDRVVIIVGEQGILDKDGFPAEEGDFIMEWWFVFQPE